jgi:HAD superfamily hydrolase (TIGR01509 family)
MFHNIILDYDGVIANTDPFNLYVIGEICKAKGYKFSGDAYQKYFAGKTLKDGFVEFLTSIDKVADLEDCITRKKAYDPQYIQNVMLFRDAVYFISEAKRTHVLALATGARRSLIEAVLARYNLTYSFQAIVAAEEYEKGKPDPEVYLATMRHLEATPDSVLVIEDSPAGVAAAKSAHLACLAVTHTHHPDLLRGADWIVQDLAKIVINDLIPPNGTK